MALPRFEYRAFAPAFPDIEPVLRAQTQGAEPVERQETYFVAPSAPDLNVKIRDDRLSVKRRLETVRGLERWQPVREEPFPLSRAYVRDELLPGLRVGLDGLTLDRVDYTASELARLLSRPYLDVIAAGVFKRRSSCRAEGCDAEIVELLVTGQAIRSIAVESEDPENAAYAVSQLGLERYRNTSYPRAIERIVSRPANWE